MKVEATEYFARLETPSAGSPVGTLVVRIIDKNPNLGLEEARAQANAMLEKAAGRKTYSVPRVYSPEERRARVEQFRMLSTLRKAA